MKLIINKTDIINAFVAKTGFQAYEIEIDMEGELSYVPRNKINLEKPQPIEQSSLPKSLLDPDVRMAIATIFDEAMKVQDQYREGRGIVPNKISLIKAIRVIIPNTGLKDAKDYVENILLKENF